LFHEDDQDFRLINYLACVVANARYASPFHGEAVLGDGLPNFKCAKSAISAISPLRDGERSVPQVLEAWVTREMDVRAEARCGQAARTYPASEF
jgi:hypothetical protein